MHYSCISHCIRHAFGVIIQLLIQNIFSFSEELKAAIGEKYSETLGEYHQQMLIAWMTRHARKTSEYPCANKYRRIRWRRHCKTIK